MSELARMGWALLLAQEFPRFLADLSLRFGLPPSQLLRRLTPREAAFLLTQLRKASGEISPAEAGERLPWKDFSAVSEMLRH